MTQQDDNNMIADVFGNGNNNRDEKLASEIAAYLQRCGIANEEVLNNTPKRWLKFIKENSLALREQYTDFLTFPSEYNQMIVVDTKFTSLCEHHLLPYYGTAVIGYLPTTRVLGVSKIIKLITHLSKKPSIQESLTEEICKTFTKNVPSAGTAIVMQALHTCVSCRYKEGHMLTSSMHGTFRHNPFAKQEFLDFANKILNR